MSPEELQHTGLKATVPRVRVLEVFQRSAQRHLSAEDVYRVLLSEQADIGLSTVYRVLSQFEQAGVLRRSPIGSSRAVYELNDRGDTHGHLIDLRDGGVIEFVDPVIEQRLREIAASHGLNLHDYVVTAFGRPPPAGDGQT